MNAIKRLNLSLQIWVNNLSVKDLLCGFFELVINSLLMVNVNKINLHRIQSSILTCIY